MQAQLSSLARGAPALLILSLVVLAAPALAAPELLPGWPQELPPGVSGGYLLLPMDGAALADLDGDGKLEIVVSSGDRVWVLGADGKALPGWPATVSGTAQAPPAVGDVDGDGKLDVVQVARGLKYSDPTSVNVLGLDGKPLPGWPKTYPNLAFRTPTLADLDGNGTLDIIVQIGRWPPAGTIEVLSSDGALLGPNWSHELDSYPIAPAAVGDLDGDGKLEVAYLTLGNLTVREADGTMRAGFPLAAEAGWKGSGGLALADLDGDGKLELLWCMSENKDGGGKVRLHAADATGKALAGFPVMLTTQDIGSPSAPTIGDVDKDGKLEIAVSLRQVGVQLVRADGQLLGSPIGAGDEITASPILVDLDGDGDLEIVTDRNLLDGTPTAQGYIDAHHHDGSPVTGFPLRTAGNTMSNSAVLADVNGDGQLELAIVSATNVDPPSSWVSLWRIPGAKSTATDWPSYGAGPRRACCAGCEDKSATPWLADGGPPDVGVDATATDAGVDAGTGNDDGSGCSCRVSAAPTASATGWLALLLLALLLRWRARARETRY